MKKRTLKNIVLALFVISGSLFAVSFGGPAILRAYVEIGIGGCRKVPVLCMLPDGEVTNPALDVDYIGRLNYYTSSKIKVCLPPGFNIIEERSEGRRHYNVNKKRFKGSVIYLLREPKDFFVGLYPQLKKEGVLDDHEFLRRVMRANLKGIKSLNDAFFVVIKSIFIPDLGDGKDIKMIHFSLGNKSGFINYNTSAKEHYFDCNIIDPGKGFYKIYIKDKAGKLGMKNILSIISTLK